MIAHWMLDAVERWALPDYWMIRETAIATPPPSEASRGGLRRFDGLLIPVSLEASVHKRKGYWTERMGLVGVEVKASRSDFLAGMRRGQFEGYADCGVIGLFVVTGRDVKTSEIPQPHGHLCCFDDLHASNGGLWPEKPLAPSIVCRRLPKWSSCELDQDAMWRIVFHCGKRVQLLERAAWDRQRMVDERLGQRFAQALRRVAEEFPS